MQNSIVNCEKITVDNSFVEDESSGAEDNGSQYESETDSGFFTLNFESKLTITNSNFTKVNGQIAALMYVAGNSEIHMSFCILNHFVK